MGRDVERTHVAKIWLTKSPGRGPVVYHYSWGHGKLSGTTLPVLKNCFDGAQIRSDSGVVNSR